ncbi:protein PtsH [Neisseria gonorrhoeae]|uniref:Protein PtsH n=1 Tax=Neisseria gonorrhoeae TaxID=485 RepID=A0A378W3J3_NEIGO|nr:protein PtsH [Neisseria gonorrhoeae]
MLKQSIEIINKLGLHARASSKFTQTASQFKSEVWVTKTAAASTAKALWG